MPRIAVASHRVGRYADPARTSKRKVDLSFTPEEFHVSTRKRRSARRQEDINPGSAADAASRGLAEISRVSTPSLLWTVANDRKLLAFLVPCLGKAWVGPEKVEIRGMPTDVLNVLNHSRWFRVLDEAG